MIRKIFGDEQPITGRPADRIAPMLPKATDGVDPKLIEHEEDILSYLLLPEPAVEYFKWRALPPEHRPETPADLELKKLKQEGKPDVSPAPQPKVQSQSPLAGVIESLVNSAPTLVQELLHKVEGLSLDEVVFRKGDQRIAVRASGAPAPVASSGVAQIPAAASSNAEPVVPVAHVEPQVVLQDQKSSVEYKRTINSPLVGKFYATPVPESRFSSRKATL